MRAVSRQRFRQQSIWPELLGDGMQDKLDSAQPLLSTCLRAAEVDYRIDPNAGGLGITSTAYLQSRITNDGFRAHRTPPDW